MKINAKILNKKIIPDYGRFEDILSQYNEQYVTINIQKAKTSRDMKTINQLRFVHAVIRELGKHLGYQVDESKFAIKRHIRGYDVDDNGLKYLKSFSAYTKTEMTEFIEKLIYFADEYGINTNKIKEDCNE